MLKQHIFIYVHHMHTWCNNDIIQNILHLIYYSSHHQVLQFPFQEIKQLKKIHTNKKSLIHIQQALLLKLLAAVCITAKDMAPNVSSCSFL